MTTAQVHYLSVVWGTRGVHTRRSSLRKLGSRGWDIRLCESGMAGRGPVCQYLKGEKTLVGGDSTHRELEKRPEQ